MTKYQLEDRKSQESLVAPRVAIRLKTGKFLFGSVGRVKNS